MLEFITILVYHHLPETKSSLRTASQPIIYFFATIQHLRAKISIAREQKAFNRIERKPVNNEVSTIFEQENYIDTTVPIRKGLVIRSLLELFCFNMCYVILIEWTFYYLVMCKCMSISVFTFECFFINYCSSSYGHFEQNRHVVTFYYSREKPTMVPKKRNCLFFKFL